MDSRVVLLPNTVIGDSYRIDRAIGAGGFGITYAAEDINLRATVAIKEYYPEEFGSRDPRTMRVQPNSERHRETFEWGRTSFLQEAQTLAQFRHPSIVRVARVFEALGTAYTVMDFEHGLLFEVWLQRLDRPPTQQELDHIVGPLLDALEMIHGAHVLHRDIAPDNIIVRPDGTPVLIDFGAARRAVAEKSRTLTGIVKPGYSPTEQYVTDSRLQGPWSDIYALGATLYRAVVGHAPNEAPLREDYGGPSASDAATGNYRPGFLATIDACLSLRYSERPQSVADLRRQFFGDGSEAPRAERRSRLANTNASGRVAPPVTKHSSAPRWIAAAAALATIATLGSYEYANGLRETDNKVASYVKQPRNEVAVDHREADAGRNTDAMGPTKKTDDAGQIGSEVGSIAEAKRKADQDAKQQAAAVAAKKTDDDVRARAEKATNPKSEKDTGKGESDVRIASATSTETKQQMTTFDGRWRSAWQAVSNCRATSSTEYFVIKGGRISGARIKSGAVRSDGLITYTRQGLFDPAVTVSYTGKLVGNRGSADSRGTMGCIGRTTLTRVGG